MKKKLIIFMSILLLTGCSKGNTKEKFVNKIENTKKYYLSGELEIINNEDIYTYAVNVSYKFNNYYKVILKNKLNDHEQVILKNDTGVYV